MNDLDLDKGMGMGRGMSMIKNVFSNDMDKGMGNNMIFHGYGHGYRHV